MDSIPHIERTINNEYYPRMPGRRASVEERREQILSAAFKVACRSRLKGLTIRATAAEAGLSAGLVLYHFKSRDGLLVALLDWLLLTTIVGVPTPEISALPKAKERLLGLIRIELELLPERLQRLELFVDYWVLGIGHPLIRRRIRRALRRYRNAILSLAKAVIEESPERFRGIEAEDLSSLVEALIEGWVMQAIVERNKFDIKRVLSTISAIVEGGFLSS